MAFTGDDNPDDISLFLRQLLHRSSTTSSPPPPPSTALMFQSYFPPMGAHAGDNNNNNNSPHLIIPSSNSSVPAVFSGSDRLVVDRISDDTLTGVVFPGGSHLSSDSLTGSVHMSGFEPDNADDCDCDSEERLEHAGDETEAKQPPCRNQSKRSRAAEVHNLSEKRRRSRINEKMKALQNLIPNSNKTDKASMLDEAIEYLKQLQLQVQMLSMRNGLSLLTGVPGILHPSQLSQMGMDLSNMTSVLNMTSDLPDSMFNLQKHSASAARPSTPTVSAATNSETVASFDLEPYTVSNCSPFEFSNSPQVICREQRVLHDRWAMKSTEMKSPEPFSFHNQHSDVKGKSKRGSQETNLENISAKNQLQYQLYAATTSAQNAKLTLE